MKEIFKGNILVAKIFKDYNDDDLCMIQDILNSRKQFIRTKKMSIDNEIK